MHLHLQLPGVTTGCRGRARLAANDVSAQLLRASQDKLQEMSQSLASVRHAMHIFPVKPYAGC